MLRAILLILLDVLTRHCDTAPFGFVGGGSSRVAVHPSLGMGDGLDPPMHRFEFQNHQEYLK